jgi:hypothetical protein
MINFKKGEFKGGTIEFTLLDTKVWIPKEVIYKISNESNSNGNRRTDVTLHNGVVMECFYSPYTMDKMWENGE